MTFANIDILLVLGMLVFGSVVWMMVKGSHPAPVRRENRGKDKRRQ